MANLDKPLPDIVSDSEVTPELKALIQSAHALSGLGRIHASFESAQAQIEMVTGKPVCVPGCGLCCKSQTPTGWELEAAHMVSLLFADERLWLEIIQRSRNWLNQQRNINSGTGIVEATNTPCPFLGARMQCLVHAGRPLSCRSYGVTRLPANYCKREKGKGELSSTWAMFDGPEYGELKESVETLYSRIKDNRMGSYTFLPILVLVESGQKVGPVPVAKLPLSVLWRDQIDNINQGSILTLAR